MSYMMSLGSQPVGELYLSPPDKNGEAFLIGHYYSGGNTRLLKFKEPLGAPEEGSPIDRMVKGEDRDMFLFEQVLELYDIIEEIHDCIKDNVGEDIDPGHKKVEKLKQLLDEEKTKLDTFIGTRDSLLECSSARYLVSNVELCQAARGW